MSFIMCLICFMCFMFFLCFYEVTSAWRAKIFAVPVVESSKVGAALWNPKQGLSGELRKSMASVRSSRGSEITNPIGENLKKSQRVSEEVGERKVVDGWFPLNLDFNVPTLVDTVRHAPKVCRHNDRIGWSALHWG